MNPIQESIARLRLARAELEAQIKQIDSALDALGDPLTGTRHEGSVLRGVLQAVQAEPNYTWSADAFPEYRRSAVNNALAALARDGHIHRVERGMYRAGHGTPAIHAAQPLDSSWEVA